MWIHVFSSHTSTKKKSIWSLTQGWFIRWSRTIMKRVNRDIPTLHHHPLLWNYHNRQGKQVFVCVYLCALVWYLGLVRFTCERWTRGRVRICVFMWRNQVVIITRHNREMFLVHSQYTMEDVQLFSKENFGVTARGRVREVGGLGSNWQRFSTH